MRKSLFIVLLLTFSITAICQKPRILITTDIGGDPDDTQSLIRLMVYNNEFEVEGLISSASGTRGELENAIIRPDLIKEIIEGYRQVYASLITHDEGFKSADDLHAVVKEGNMYRGWDNVGTGKDTEGSDWIIKMVDRQDERPLGLCIFGGQTDLAQALCKVKSSRTRKEYEQFISNIRVYDISDQDGIFNLIIKEHPRLFYILSKSPENVDKREGAYRGIYLGGDESQTSLEWLKKNVLENHGPLGALYPQKTWTAPNPHSALKEGDTPSWFYFLKNGLNSLEHPEYGGWGGRYQMHQDGYYYDAEDLTSDGKNARATVYRWRDDFQRDFAARMDWCVNDLRNANHKPLVSVNGKADNKAEYLVVKSGKRIILDASDSQDPDGDFLSFKWMIYPEPGKYSGAVDFDNKGEKIQFTAPNLAAGQSLHIILRVTDNGEPRLTSYRRIVVSNPGQ